MTKVSLFVAVVCTTAVLWTGCHTKNIPIENAVNDPSPDAEFVHAEDPANCKSDAYNPAAAFPIDTNAPLPREVGASMANPIANRLMTTFGAPQARAWRAFRPATVLNTTQANRAMLFRTRIKHASFTAMQRITPGSAATSHGCVRTNPVTHTANHS